ncbi:hypothetical protein [Alteraurantiacibacter aquimixticola]|uniref:Uncharacterized protein n=1 Tax=Alteraurantiacibacter aquimixticola TaxID=2489173 RepID=A0A4T3F3S9_9SPHN|nr:hypothetical protein [Alteraurantiacibacter aquimixticola]TIX51935.1 hypothetical protein E5222_05730 [Alteraurantiacibacter aquimixticola]
MTAIAISLLFGFAAFVALAAVAWGIARGMTRGQEIMEELVRLDAATGRKVSRSRRAGRAPFAPQRPFAAA